MLMADYENTNPDYGHMVDHMSVFRLPHAYIRQSMGQVSEPPVNRPMTPMPQGNQTEPGYGPYGA